MDAEAIPGIITVPAGQVISLPLPPAKNGYAFDGWYTAKGSAGIRFDPTAAITQSVTLYAHWTEHAYTVKFDWGAGVQTNIPFAYNSLITPPEPISRAGFRLTGWFKNVELTIPWEFETELLKGDITLHAQWTPEYAVSFETSGGSPVAGINNILQGSLILPPAEPVKDGAIFTGWYKDAALTKPWSFLSDTVTADITLYASWSAAGNATVTFNTNGGVAKSPVERPIGGVIGNIGDPVRVGDIFQGWFSDEGLTVPWDLYNYPVPGNMTLYAKWNNLGNMTFFYPFDDERELAISENPYAPIALNAVMVDKSEKGVGANPGALKFEGDTSYLRINGNSFPYGTGKNFTVSMWIKPETVGVRQNLFACAPSGTTANDWLTLQPFPIPGTSELGGYLGQSNLGDSTVSEGIFPVFSGIDVKPMKAGEWAHIAVAVEADRIKYYVNGQQVGQTNSARWYGSAASYFSLGGRSGDTNTAGCYSGLMDEVRFYDFALSASQISLLYGYVDAANLDKAIAQAELLDEGEYTADSWAAFAAALNGAKAVSASPVSQESVNAAFAELTAAMNSLVAIPFPTVYITGPSSLMLNDQTAVYTFSMKNMPANTGAISLTFSVEDEFFTGQSLYPLGGWDVIQDSGWIQDGPLWKKTLTLAKAGGVNTGVFDIYEIVLNNKGVAGTAKVVVTDISAATPGGTVPVKNAGPAVTVIEPFNRYDVNRDKKVDLADVAAAAYFFMAKAGDPGWSTPVEFAGADGKSVFVTPAHCDVNQDGSVDVEDLILILANFT
jgi:uncharacterized repeat protein (TIGR02543 family)